MSKNVRRTWWDANTCKSLASGGGNPSVSSKSQLERAVIIQEIVGIRITHLVHINHHLPPF